MKKCLSCQREFSVEAPGGLCPICVLKGAHESQNLPEWIPLNEVQAAIPDLEIIECIGRGGMGIVYRAKEVASKREVALKLLDPSFNDQADFAERFEREARTLGELKHPNIVSIHDFGKSEDFYWLTMELIDGVNLRQAMQTEKFTPQQALEIIPSLCSALQYAHDNGVYHRDVKPENILLGSEGEIKIADFGIARMVGEKAEMTLTKTGSTLGTTAYLAPEQIESPQDVDHRADIYSLGVVFYEMLTGNLPLGRFPAPSKKTGSHPDLDEIVFRALEKEREQRFQHAGDLSSEVRNASKENNKLPEHHTNRPEIIAGISLFGFGLTLAGILFLPLTIIGFALMITGAVLGWHTLRSDSHLPKKQRKLLKGASLLLPLAFIGFLILVIAIIAAFRLMIPIPITEGEIINSGPISEQIDTASSTVRQMIEAGQQGQVSEATALFSNEMIEALSYDDGLSDRMKIAWKNIEPGDLKSASSSMRGPTKTTVQMKKDGKKFLLPLIWKDGECKIDGISLELMKGLKSSPKNHLEPEIHPESEG